MQNFIFIDETLDKNITHTYELSIQAGLNGLSFCVLDITRNKYITLAHQNFTRFSNIEDSVSEIEKIIKKTDLLNRTYKTVKLIWISPKNTLIPTPLFTQESLKTYFEYNHQLDELDEIHFHKLTYIDASSVYTIPNTMANLFIKQFPSIKIFNQQVPFLNNIILKHHTEQTNVFVNIHDEFIDIALIEKGKLLFYNNFPFKNDSDISYYILFIFDQFKLNKEINELIFSGFIEKNKGGYKNIQNFIKHIKFEKLPEEYTYSYTFNKIPAHSFSNLFNLHSCE